MKSAHFFDASSKERRAANDLGIEGPDAPVFRFSDPQADRPSDYLARHDSLGTHGSLGELVANIRFVAVGSQLAQPVKEFVNAAFGPVTIYSVEKDNIRGFSSQTAPFSIIVALFDDITRAKRAFRAHKALMDNKLCYAVLTESKPSARANLMRFAFDDVFDTRMKPAEMIVRIQSHRNRQKIYNSVIQDDEGFQIFCDENIEGRVYISQMEILRLLYNNLGKVVRYRDLASYDFHSGDFRLKSLKVRIYNLRKRLRNFEIHCVRGAGYTLVKCEN